MNKKLIINIALAIVALFFAFLVVNSVLQPVLFDKTLEQRQDGTWNSDIKKIHNDKGEYEVCVKQSLIDIRDAQQLYKQTHNKYADNFDSLIYFVKTDSLPIIHKVHDENDTTYTKTIDKISRYVSVLDTLFGHRADFNIDNLCYIPFSQGDTVKFEMEADFITKNNVNVAVFEVRAPLETYLWDQDPQRVKNLRADKENHDKYPGYKVGSLTDLSTSGNWESL